VSQCNILEHPWEAITVLSLKYFNGLRALKRNANIIEPFQ
jgi:hypothetical protein